MTAPLAKPLDGIRVVDASHVFAIPNAARILAELGAEVIKIQAHTRIDLMSPTGPFPENEPGDRPVDRVGCLNTVNRGKLGLSLDLEKPAALDVMHRLIDKCDIVMESFTPRVLKRFKLDYASLSKAHPKLIMLSNTGYGHTGPWSEYGCVATTLEATCGFCWLSGFEDGPPSKVAQSYPDFLASWNAVYAILAALFAQRRTGLGRWIDLSMHQASASTLGVPMLQFVANGEVAHRIGNQHPAMAPHGIYPSLGEDRWIAIAVDSDAGWLALRNELGNPSWATEPEFDHAAGRKRRSKEIDTHLASWTASQDAFALAERLQEKGIMASALQNGRDLLGDAQLRSRGFFESVDHPEPSGIGRRTYIGHSWKLSGDEGRKPTGPAPMIGEHSRQILVDLLGYDNHEANDLFRSSAVGDLSSPQKKLAPLPLGELRRQNRIGRHDPDYLIRQDVSDSADPAACQSDVNATTSSNPSGRHNIERAAE